MLISLGFLPVSPALADYVQPVEYTASTSETIVRAYAVKYGVNGDKLVNTLRCESGLASIQSNILNKKGPNGHEDSWGVAQIHLPAHPDISKEEAMNPLFAIDYAAREFSKGHASQWSCYKSLYGARDA